MDKQYEENILSLESNLDRLFTLANTIESTGGMCKSFAMEAIDVLPNFNNSLPKAYYSANISIAQYKLSLESIISGIWEFIVKIITAIKDQIVKFINWLFPTKKSTDAPDIDDLKEKVEKAEKSDFSGVEKAMQAMLDEIYADAAKAMKKDSSAMEDGVINFSNYRIIRNADDIVDTYISGAGENSQLAYLLNDKSPHFHDIMNKGSYYRSFKEVKEAVRQLNDYLKTARADIETLNKSVSNNDVGVADVATYIIKGQSIKGKSDYTYAETAAYIADQRVESNNNKPKSGIVFSKLNSVFSESIKSLQFSDTLDVVSRVSSYITVMGEKLDVLTKSIHNVKDTEKTEMANIVRDSLKIIRSDLIGCLSFIRELGYYANVLSNMHKRLIDANKELLKIIKDEIVKIYGKLPDNIENIYSNANALFQLAA